MEVVKCVFVFIFFLWLFYLVGIWPSIYRQLPGCQANNYFFQNTSKTNPWNKFIIMKQNYSFSVNTNYWNINWNMELKHKLKHKLKHRLKHKFKTQFKTRFVISNVRRLSWISVWRLIRFDRYIVLVHCNPTDFRLIKLQCSCHLTDFQIDRVTMSIWSNRLKIRFKPTRPICDIVMDKSVFLI